MMASEVVVAACSLVGTLLGSIGGILVSNKLVNYRIEQLEKKMDKHNSLIERMTAAEVSVKQAHKRLDRLAEGGA